MGDNYRADYGMFTRDRRGEEAARKLVDERREADAEMAIKYANLHMPEDIRSRAAAWGMSAWAEVLWNSAFQAGYREGMRDREGEDGEASDQA